MDALFSLNLKSDLNFGVKIVWLVEKFEGMCFFPAVEAIAVE